MEETLSRLLERGGSDRPAIVVPGGPTLSHGRLRKLVLEGADRLAAFGVGPGDRVAMALPSGPEAIVLFLAAALGATACPLNPSYKEDEFRFYLEDTGARFLLLPKGEGGAARSALPPGGVVIETEIDAQGRLQMESAQPETRERTASAAAGDDVALVLHTSGTTSRPKRVPLRHRNLVASVDHVTDHYQLSEEDVSLCLMPLFHVHGLVASALAALAAGGAVVTPRKFSPLGFWALAKEYQPTWFSASPTPHRMVLLRTSGDRPAGTERLRFVRSCSAALSPGQMAEMEARFGVPVLEAYGMTEASHQMASNPLPPGERRPGSVGPGTGVEIATMTEEGQLLPSGSAGEVVIRGANVIDGYEANPAANAASFQAGWFRTGDLGVLDAGGYLTLSGRLKELINRGGEKIAPLEVDGVLESHPAVAEAVCFGLPHSTWGEEVAAAVVLSSEADEKSLRAYCREHLAEFKVPTQLFIVETIPRTATGKVQRRFVAEAFATR
ncbi:MAG TPA: AMP-binding protein [Candidatus Acidoferrales bacterium]|nr:AMP-binding protein [Candidatus Acidoferrales bacterium]HVC38811.1 AMP-binding protein [Candidatus Dormibacteraeota bacterium]